MEEGNLSNQSLDRERERVGGVQDLRILPISYRISPRQPVTKSEEDSWDTRTQRDRKRKRGGNKCGTVPIRYGSEDSAIYIFGTFYLSVNLNPFKIKLKIACVSVGISKIPNMSRPDMMSLRSYKITLQMANLSAPVNALCVAGTGSGD